jgi:hypothetical protein
MTVIRDPGNQAESRVDALSRAWRTTAGLWKTDEAARVVTIAARDATIVTRDATIVTRDATIAADVVTIAARDATIVATASLAGPSSPSSALSGTILSNAWYTLAGTLTAPRTGYYRVTAYVYAPQSIGAVNVNKNGTLRIQVAGATVITGPASGLPLTGGSGTPNTILMVTGDVLATNGQVISIQGFLDNEDSTRALYGGSLVATFIPTPTYPH